MEPLLAGGGRRSAGCTGEKSISLFGTVSQPIKHAADKLIKIMAFMMNVLNLKLLRHV
jgi:hypothetical protein